MTLFRRVNRGALDEQRPQIAFGAVAGKLVFAKGGADLEPIRLVVGIPALVLGFLVFGMVPPRVQGLLGIEPDDGDRFPSSARYEF